MSGPVPIRGPRSAPPADRQRQHEAPPTLAERLAAITGGTGELGPSVRDAIDPGAPPSADPLTGVDDAVLLFGAETGAASAALLPPAVQRRRWTWRSSGVIAGVLMAASITGAILAYVAMGGFAPTPSGAVGTAGADVGTVVINTQPPGAEVSVDGVGRGVSPVTVALTGGEHTVELRNGAVTRMVPVAVQAGTSSSHYFEMTQAAGAFGRLEVASDPSGASVSVDGARRGTTPLTLEGVAAGARRVVISNGAATITRTVRVSAGTTASIFASVASAAPRGTAGGWVQIRAPFELQVSEGGELLGTTRAERIMLPTGRHQLLVSNSAYEFSTSATVDVASDRTATVQVDVPNGTLHVNAIPWAEVAIDGRAYGVTPLGNVSIPLGPHEVVFRHPQLGERRRTVQVTARTPVRLGVDFNQ